MTVLELMNALKALAPVSRTETCDVLIAGSETAQVRKACVCFKATADVIARAARAGAQLLITHEPVFYGSEHKADADRIALQKWALIEQCGITIYRFHDYAHECEPDFIHEGFLRALNLRCSPAPERESLGIRLYTLEHELTAAALASCARDALGIECPRIAGDPNTVVRTMCLGLGAVGPQNLRVLIEKDADAFITGETGEVYGYEYIRDAVYFGHRKALILLGHCGAEYAGMRLLADEISRRFMPAEYIHCGDPYTCSDDVCMPDR